MAEPAKPQILLAEEAIARCRTLAGFSENSTGLTRTFLSPPMHACHQAISKWMQSLEMLVETDAIGNLRGVYPGLSERRLIIGSHIDTVPNAGAFDGALGVMIGLALVDGLARQRLPFEIEVIAFSEEEGVRFAKPFLGSLALVGGLNLEGAMAQAVRDFGLDPERIDEAKLDASRVIGYVEFHIEQGPVLEEVDLPLAVVAAIAGQSRFAVTFTGAANHAGTTPMRMRRDALAAAAEWVLAVERTALVTEGLVATVGSIEALPNAGNVIAGEARVGLDVRHQADEVRLTAVKQLLDEAAEIGLRRGVGVAWSERLNQATVQMDADLIALAERAVPFKMVSGAGHDAMILAAVVPSVMLFVRSPGGVSHHPDETVRAEDVAAAIGAGLSLLQDLAKRYN
jgi:allantoate deiminase